MTNDAKHLIDLTGPASHTLTREPGVGLLRLGPASQGKQADLHVEAHLPLNWHAFDAFTTPAGSPWPRALYYTGSDEGVFAWARQRPIETLHWTPILTQDTRIDASHSAIQILAVDLSAPGAHLHLTLPGQQTGGAHRHLSLKGDLTRLSIDGDLPCSLDLAPATLARHTAAPFELPDLGALHQVDTLSLHNGPMAQPISLKGLERFAQLRSLSLYGHFCDLERLADHRDLHTLHLRFMPALEGLPALDHWPLLEGFVAFNVEAEAGKRLRQQLKARSKVRAWAGHASVSQLRSAAWWQSEFGRPFSAWPKRQATLANQAFDQALAQLAQAQDLTQAEAAISTFAARFNAFKNIETGEREDLGEAVWQLSQTPQAVQLGVTASLALRWFDTARDY
ncbi:hypothetical protein IFR09_26620 [Pseudomonas syringae]|nr:hypothetical protein [Pseudomonas syringae]MBD8792295.1 hypothetical protein [Pseudomonas syringae]MBD8803570.1 hypothetical protein [Pseudomonas syringae]MBD8814743.1 hypothetical protein [Pseudomonas syringae]